MCETTKKYEFDEERFRKSELERTEKFDKEREEGCKNPFTENDVLKMADEDDYIGFLKTVAYVFELDFNLVHELANRDYLWRPKICKNYVNYVQWLTIGIDCSRDPINETLSYLFTQKDPEYDEPYCHNDNEVKLIKTHYVDIFSDYASCDEYLEAVSKRLWKDKDYIKTSYEYLFKRACIRLKTFYENDSRFNKVVS